MKPAVRWCRSLRRQSLSCGGVLTIILRCSNPGSRYTMSMAILWLEYVTDLITVLHTSFTHNMNGATYRLYNRSTASLAISRIDWLIRNQNHSNQDSFLDLFSYLSSVSTISKKKRRLTQIKNEIGCWPAYSVFPECFYPLPAHPSEPNKRKYVN